MMTPRARAFLALTSCAALLLAGCGSSGTSSMSASPVTLAKSAPPTAYSGSSPSSSAPALPDSDRWRPTAHLTAATGWAGNPSGLIFDNGTYHVFYQHNPSGDSPDPAALEWAHATSTDLVTWSEQPVALPAGDEQVLSGSVVLDIENASGLGTDDAPPLVAVYTSVAVGSDSTSQSVAFSTDQGQTWEQYSDNPILDNSGSTTLRDPKVFWYEPGGYWVMVTADPDEHAVSIHKSTNLRTWQPLSDFGRAGSQAGAWQSPDLFPLALDGDPENVKWVLLVTTTDGAIAGGSGVQYFVGSFDGTSFVAEPLGPAGVGAVQPGEMHSWMDWGPDFTGAGTFNGTSNGTPTDGATAGGRIALAWMDNAAYAAAVPTSPWRGAMTLPRELALVTVDGVPRLTQTIPAQAQTALTEAGPSFTEPSLVTSGSRKLGGEASGTHLVVEATLVPGEAAVAGVIVLGSSTGQRGTRVQYVKETGLLQVDRSNAGRADFSPAFAPGSSAPVGLTDGKLTVRIVVDGSTVEVFAGGVALSAVVLPAADDDAVSVFGGGGKATIENVVVTPIGG